MFLGWEGIEARRSGVQLNTFKLEDYGIPYGYSPVLATHPDTLQRDPEAVKRFLEATARGYQHAAEHPREAAQLMCQAVAQDTRGKPLPSPLDEEMVAEAQQYIAPSYLAPGGRRVLAVIILHILFHTSCLPLFLVLIKALTPGSCKSILENE